MYEPSRVLLSFHIAGFQYADGALVLGDLKAGDKLTLCAERDNPHDPEAGSYCGVFFLRRSGDLYTTY